MEKELLPIGSVVLLKGAKKRLMVTGYYSMPLGTSNEKVYDYNGCSFPEGIIDSKKCLLFNHSEIENIYYYGLKDQEQVEFINELTSAMDEDKKEENKKDVESTNPADLNFDISNN